MSNNNVNVIKKYAGVLGKFRFIALGVPLLLALFIGIAPFIFHNEDIALFIGLIIILLPVVLVLFALGVYALNQFPIISLVEQGILLSHNFSHLFIPWQEISSVKGDRHFPLGRIYVFSHTLPPLYSMYGLERIQGSRAFIIDPTLK